MCLISCLGATHTLALQILFNTELHPWPIKTGVK